MRIKRILSLYVAAMVFLSSLFFCVSSAGAASGASFTPRLTEPAKTNKYYFDADYNLFYKYGYGMPTARRMHTEGPTKFLERALTFALIMQASGGPII